jgi:hypothetical protein
MVSGAFLMVSFAWQTFSDEKIIVSDALQTFSIALKTFSETQKTKNLVLYRFVDVSEALCFPSELFRSLIEGVYAASEKILYSLTTKTPAVSLIYSALVMLKNLIVLVCETLTS